MTPAIHPAEARGKETNLQIVDEHETKRNVATTEPTVDATTPWQEEMQTFAEAART